jgi:pimeloyl-ACP methyl ester carboxylesterase
METMSRRTRATTLDQPVGPTSHSYFSQRLRLHYVDWGNADAPPLILLHGGRDHCRAWDGVAAELRHDWHIIAPDLRGHGDSEWPSDGNYGMAGFLYDLAQLVHQQKLAPVSIIAHSLGGNISLRYAGLYPDAVRKLVAIEGIGPAPKIVADRDRVPVPDRLRAWIDERRALAGRLPRRYASIEEATHRMQEANRRLTPELARHLTEHGVNQNEDGTYSWKFDNYVRAFRQPDMTTSEQQQLWDRIACPTLMFYGRESWASNPAEDGRIRLFRTARVVSVEGAGHWVHHDRLDLFLDEVRRFL